MSQLPKEFVAKYQNLLGEEESKVFFEAIENDNTKKGFRLNSLKNNFQKVKYSLKDPITFVDNAYYGTVSGNDVEWVSGDVYSQDPSAMYPAQIADVQPGEKVLDLCAAPGGKSTALAEKLGGEGLLVANEISNTRAKILRENLERWGATNVVITNESPDKLATKFINYFDKIIIDAPCSGEGMFRKDPNAMKYWSPDYVLKCQIRQKEIIQEAIKMLRPGGKIIYSTCTYSPEEDEQIVSWLVNEYGFKILPVKHYTGMASGRPEWADNNKALKETVRLWFQDGVGEGQFAALLQAPDKDEVVKVKKNRKKDKRTKITGQKLDKKQQELVAKVLDRFVLPTQITNWSKNVVNSNNHIYLPAIVENDLQGLHVLSNGVELGILKKNRFEPGHQLAEVLGQKEQTQVINLATEEAYRKFLHGETLKVDSELHGFVLVSYQDHVFSFGKIGGDKMLKNFYPKGLRK
ncbi:RsmF rRNA methyltransferase first C-terminal domain-containing protein [Lactobacillus sp.]|uniref:RsmB/NOP family class I SAM-dependent RNA methyltransferase n=1 Tax=Lactobacillus sp. TaxID=1591 RepID=UPI001982B4B9|nr:RsmF rRNA methyltransferase first C-terminal domain-containing protein [Lactobacillus sp.]MBD5429364.1 methyltransferase domain-containing protein [Lactobacillus sp.]